MYMYSVSLVCVVMYWKIGQFYKDSESAGYKGIYYYIIFSFPPDTTGVQHWRYQITSETSEADVLMPSCLGDRDR